MNYLFRSRFVSLNRCPTRNNLQSRGTATAERPCAVACLVRRSAVMTSTASRCGGTLPGRRSKVVSFHCGQTEASLRGTRPTTWPRQRALIQARRRAESEAEGENRRGWRGWGETGGMETWQESGSTAGSERGKHVEKMSKNREELRCCKIKKVFQSALRSLPAPCGTPDLNTSNTPPRSLPSRSVSSSMCF